MNKVTVLLTAALSISLVGGCSRPSSETRSAATSTEKVLAIRGFAIGMDEPSAAAVATKEGWAVRDGKLIGGPSTCAGPEADSLPFGTCSQVGQLDFNEGRLVAFELRLAAFTPEDMTVEQFVQKIVSSYSVGEMTDSPSSYMSSGAGVQINHHYSGTSPSGETVEISGNSYFQNPSLRVHGGLNSDEKFN